MSDQTAAGAASLGKRIPEFEISHEDAAVLRDLAERVAELSSRPIEQEKRELWYKHNALEPTRPLIFCDPENGWNEIITQDQLQCVGQLARSWEMLLRKEIFWGSQMCDDRVIEPVFRIPWVYTETDYGVTETKIGGESGGAYTWDPPIKTEADLEKLRIPVITVDYEATRRLEDIANDVVGGALEVRVANAWWWSFGMTWPLIRLRGLDQMMFDMFDNPDLLHRLMAFLRDCYIAKFDFLEKHGLLSLNNDGTYVGSGGFGWSRELPQPEFAGSVRTIDMWGFAESQETVGVSPGLFEEFVFPYQLKLLERFGLNCYGCCEPVDKRWHVLQRIPRLRRVSVSPWSSIETMAELLSDNYIFSFKPNPADLAMPTFDEERIRAGLRHAMDVTRNCRLEVIMKDNHTIGRDPQRVIRWVQIAREEAERI